MDSIKTELQKIKAILCKLPNGRGKLQFRVGEPAENAIYTIRDGTVYGSLSNLSLPTNGEDKIIINQCCSVVGSVRVYMDGVRIPEEYTDVGHVDITYTNKKITIKKTPAFTDYNLIVVEYEHTY